MIEGILIDSISEKGLIESTHHEINWVFFQSQVAICLQYGKQMWMWNFLLTREKTFTSASTCQLCFDWVCSDYKCNNNCTINSAQISDYKCNNNCTINSAQISRPQCWFYSFSRPNSEIQGLFQALKSRNEIQGVFQTSSTTWEPHAYLW